MFLQKSLSKVVFLLASWWNVFQLSINKKKWWENLIFEELIQWVLDFVKKNEKKTISLSLDSTVIVAFGNFFAQNFPLFLLLMAWVNHSSLWVWILKNFYGFMLFYTEEIWLEIYLKKLNSPYFLDINTCPHTICNSWTMNLLCLPGSVLLIFFHFR